MDKKYKDSLYPDKINDLVDNEGNLNPEALSNVATKEYVDQAIATALDGLLEEEF